MNEWTNEWLADKSPISPVSVHELYSLHFLFCDQLLIAEREHLPLLLLTICRVGLTSSSETATPYSEYLNWVNSATTLHSPSITAICANAALVSSSMYHVFWDCTVPEAFVKQTFHE